MGSTCVVVADGSSAKFFLLESGAQPTAKRRLVEQQRFVNPELERVAPESRHSNRDAGPRHPYGAQRKRHHLELERRFAAEVVERTAALVSTWGDGVVVLVAEARLLGLLRETMRASISGRIRLKELAREYAHLSAADVLQQLESSNVLVS